MPSERPSSLRAWFYLIRLSLRRQARARQMVLIALGLLAFAAVFIRINTVLNFWNMRTWRKRIDDVRFTFQQLADVVQTPTLGFPRPGPMGSVEYAVMASLQVAFDQTPFVVFSDGFVLTLFLGFLLPIWCLSFATEALGGEREGNNLIWLLSRPLSRWSIYLAKFLALLPWSLGLALGGFALLCVLAGKPGLLALKLFWPSVLCAALAFSALFYLVGALFRRPAVIAIVYVFFLEILLNLMPGYLKRFSIGYYARCMMYEEAKPYGVGPDNPSLFLPVSGAMAQMVLLSATAALLVVGTLLFRRTEYHEVGT